MEPFSDFHYHCLVIHFAHLADHLRSHLGVGAKTH